MDIQELKDKLMKIANFTVEALPEHISVRGNLIVSGDDELDRKYEDEVLKDLEHNPWAWCIVKVTAKYLSFEASAYLGCCSYMHEDQFLVEDSYADMKYEACESLAQEIFATKKDIERLFSNSL